MSSSTSSRVSRLREARRIAVRKLAAFGAVGVIAVGVVAVTAYAVFLGPDRALALMEPLPDGAIGMTAIAPAASPAPSVRLTEMSHVVDAAPIAETDASAGAAPRLAMTKPARLKAVAVKKRSAEAKLWKRAFCSTYGIGDGLLGSGLAGGGRLGSDSMVVAHKTLPFGTKIKFKYHGRTCIAVVKDRGPYVEGRTFDLGPGVANTLGFGGIGTVSYHVVKG